MSRSGLSVAIQTDGVEDASIAKYENAKALALINVWMKRNKSQHVRSPTKDARLLRNDILSLKFICHNYWSRFTNFHTLY